MIRTTLAALLTVACGTACRPKFPLCKQDSDCAAEESNHGAVRCIDGQCQECKTDADCAGGKRCASMRCVVAAAATSAATSPEALPPPSASDGVADCHLDQIHFDFNSAELSADAQAKLQKVAQCLEHKGSVRVRVEGFCDDRGTEEYNLALGQRRAFAVEKYLQELGIQRISSISYGKDAPVCQENTEACWKRNRRAEFDVSKK
ncbi:MAG: OmpA family protein [Deltaproteobacteria bacterium]